MALAASATAALLVWSWAGATRCPLPTMQGHCLRPSPNLGPATGYVPMVVLPTRQGLRQGLGVRLPPPFVWR